MPSLVQRHGVRAALAVLALAVCSAASALPPTESDPGSAAGGAALRPAAAAPLPTLVPPANDDIASATAVAGLPYADSLGTVEATTAPGDPTCAGANAASVWYAYSSPLGVWLTADTFGSGYDTTLAVYTGTPGALVEVACNDDAGGPQSQVAFPVSAGVTYYVMAAGKTGGGSLELALDVKPPLAQIGVRTTHHYESAPSAGPNHFAWGVWQRPGGRNWKLRVKPTGQPHVRVNAPKTDGFSGGFEGTTFVYQEARGRGGERRSDLKMFDLVSRRRSNPPAGVNTRHWEFHPTMSGDWLLFGRQTSAENLVVLRNLKTGKTLVLARAGGKRWAEPGQVSGNYAVWYRCAPRCDVFVYDIAARTKRMIPNPGGRHQYEPGVTDDGTVYFTSSGNGCGVSVRLERRSPEGPSVLLASLRPPFDSFSTFALRNADGTTSFFYERRNCRTVRWDILKVVDP